MLGHIVVCLHVRIVTSRETLFPSIASECCGRGGGGLHGWIDDDHGGEGFFTEKGLSLAWSTLKHGAV